MDHSLSCLPLLLSYLVKNLYQNLNLPRNGSNLQRLRESKKQFVKRKSGTKKNKNGLTGGEEMLRTRKRRNNGSPKFQTTLVSLSKIWIIEYLTHSYPADDYDPIKEEKDARKSRVSKNEKQRAANVARAQAGPMQPAKTREDRKDQIRNQVLHVKASTASMGKWAELISVYLPWLIAIGLTKSCKENLNSVGSNERYYFASKAPFHSYLPSSLNLPRVVSKRRRPPL